MFSTASQFEEKATPRSPDHPIPQKAACYTPSTPPPDVQPASAPPSPSYPRPHPATYTLVCSSTSSPPPIDAVPPGHPYSCNCPHPCRCPYPPDHDHNDHLDHHDHHLRSIPRAIPRAISPSNSIKACRPSLRSMFHQFYFWHVSDQQCARH
jgi:hypothetical protein